MKKISVLFLIFFMAVSVGPSKVMGSDYELYRASFQSVRTLADAEGAGYKISGITFVKDFFKTKCIGKECTVYTAVNMLYGRAALFFADDKGNVVYKTDELECNHFFKDSLKQPTIGIAAIAERDINGDGLKDILIISQCANNGKKFKIGDILFQGKTDFYRDWRISDKINRFSMNKDLDMMTAFARDGQSAEFLYSASTLAELTKDGFVPLKGQIFNADFEKFGTVKVVPGTYTMGVHFIFIIYLVDSEGRVVWNFQCMRNYDNFSKLTGISFKDVDGDGWADLSILTGYTTLNDNNETQSTTDFSIYYQRDGYFFEDRDFHDSYIKNLSSNETIDGIVQAARKYWGWQI